ncbi:MAG TPA: hypothetical protein ENI05_09570 [Porticoccus sp.]|nr:hypothetical protein [Porticoccus sp.]
MKRLVVDIGGGSTNFIGRRFESRLRESLHRAPRFHEVGLSIAHSQFFKQVRLCSMLFFIFLWGV